MRFIVTCHEGIGMSFGVTRAGKSERVCSEIETAKEKTQLIYRKVLC